MIRYTIPRHKTLQTISAVTGPVICVALYVVLGMGLTYAGLFLLPRTGDTLVLMGRSAYAIGVLFIGGIVSAIMVLPWVIRRFDLYEWWQKHAVVWSRHKTGAEIRVEWSPYGIRIDPGIYPAVTEFSFGGNARERLSSYGITIHGNTYIHFDGMPKDGYATVRLL